MQRTSVLVVGGSLVGLSTSLFLASRGVEHILIDKHPGSAPHPRAMGFTETTLEHFRAVGIAERIPVTPADFRLRRTTVSSLAGAWHAETDWTPDQHRDQDLSPCTGAAIAQDKLEPILREAARERGAAMQLGVELVSFRQDAAHVVARLRPRDGSPEYDVVADYMIAADGASSMIRESLGIGRGGVGHLRTLRSVLFRCPAADPFLEKGIQQFAIEQPGFRAFLTTYGDSRWVLMFEDDEERTPEELSVAVVKALGDDLPFDIITTGRWEMAGRIADKYAEGRIFLVGDAAHQLPPTRGGFGANTGIDDAWNLAWKLERVLRGTSSPALLDTYDAERRPIGWLRHQQTFSRPDYAGWVGADFVPEPLFGDDAMEYGQCVRSAAVMATAAELPAAASPRQWTGQPGTRAPHCSITRDDSALSSLDLFGRGFVLLAGDDAWQSVADRLPIELVVVGRDVRFPAAGAFEKHFGVGPTGASLIRPDGIVAWRAASVDECKVLPDVFARVTCASVAFATPEAIHLHPIPSAMQSVVRNHNTPGDKQ